MPETGDNQLIVMINITDWREKSREKELELVTAEDIRARLLEGVSTGEIACIAAANREVGLADADILPPNKLAYYSGLRRAVSSVAKRTLAQVELANGKHISVPELVGRPHRTSAEDGDEHAEDQPSYVAYDSEAALERAERYLLKHVPGHVYNHLKVIAAASGDVRGVVDQLKARIGECGARLY